MTVKTLTTNNRKVFVSVDARPCERLVRKHFHEMAEAAIDRLHMAAGFPCELDDVKIVGFVVAHTDSGEAGFFALQAYA